MTSLISKAVNRCRAISNTAHDVGLRIKASGGAGISIAPAGGLGGLSQFQQQGANRSRYARFRGWVHAAINAIASEAGQQPVNVGYARKKGAKKKLNGTKLMRLPRSLKSIEDQLEIDENHPLLKSLERPNDMQRRPEFVYSFIANLCLTGWSFVIGGVKKNKDGTEGWEFYSLPTTWIVPENTGGKPFSRFKVINPNNPSAGQDTWFARDQISFAYIPNPADPLSALSLTQAQEPAITIDDNIQSSQTVFFENGVFPSVIVTVGSNPHPGVAPGVRPRLTGVQRRQIHAAIKGTMSGVHNYGNPAIVDGLIEKIERLQMTQQEMGWEKSEKSARTRILSAFSVHPFILGEEMAGSYAQAYIVESRFFKKVNGYLSQLAATMTDLARSFTKDEEVRVWWEELKAVDPQMERDKHEKAFASRAISQNEYRAFLNLPPDEDGEQAEIDRAALQAISAIAEKVTAGALTPEQGQALLEGAGLTSKLAKRVAGEGPPEPIKEEIAMQMAQVGLNPDGTPMQQSAQPVADDGTAPPKPGGNPRNKPPSAESAVESAAASLEKALGYLSKSPAEEADEILASCCGVSHD